MASMYVAGLLTDWYVQPDPSPVSRPSPLCVYVQLTPQLALTCCVAPCRRIVYTSSPSTSGESTAEDPTDVYIGRSEGAMWMRIVSSWLAVALYLWSLSVHLIHRCLSSLVWLADLVTSSSLTRYAPVLMPDRFGDV